MLQLKKRFAYMVESVHIHIAHVSTFRNQQQWDQKSHAAWFQNLLCIRVLCWNTWHDHKAPYTRWFSHLCLPPIMGIVLARLLSKILSLHKTITANTVLFVCTHTHMHRWLVDMWTRLRCLGICWNRRGRLQWIQCCLWQNLSTGLLPEKSCCHSNWSSHHKAM